jgi:hypothetical protein
VFLKFSFCDLGALCESQILSYNDDEKESEEERL